MTTPPTQVLTEERTLTDTVGETSGLGFHPEAVLNYRMERFVELGYDLKDAEALAATRIDLTQMMALLSAGCSLELAWKILIGTMWSGDDPLWTEHGYEFVGIAVTDDEDDGA